ncbi:MAG: site-specific integrase, partial [Planctomycetota bacterium]
MPRLIHSTPKYRRHRGSGQAVVTIDGVDHYLGRYGTRGSKVEYERLIGEWLARKREPSPDPTDDSTVTELAIRYWKFAETYYRKDGRSTGVTSGIKVALRSLRNIYGHTRARDFGPLALQAVQRRMVDAGHSRPYINENVARIKRMFRWAASQELVSEAVYRAVTTAPSLKKGRTEAREPQPIGPVPDEVVDTTLLYLPPAVADMVRFHRLVGCRPSEVCLIRPCDVDRSGDVWCYIPETHKTEHHDRQRRIYIGPRAQEVLLPY